MPRVRWYRLLSSLLLFMVVFSAFWIVAVRADCWYDSQKHEEGAEVATAEPCLNCTCTKGALLCYLRVCPKLPDPPPPGCILLHRYMKCCPELICTDIPGGGNGIEARSDPENFEIGHNTEMMGNACIFNGSIYGPGSAMGSSTLCEYCYCLGGRQRCVKPKCLLPLEGCTPMYEPPSCCPVRYNCTEPPPSVTTTTLSPFIEDRSGCIVSNTFYPEGGKVLGVGHSICDNCYCIRGLLRCEPLSCAPPLLGCTPVIKPGECCAASYNCSGVIEIQPEPNYGEYPIVSKEYAKLRKEVQQKPQHTNKPAPITENSNVPFYVIAESQQKIKNPTTRHFTGTQQVTTKNPYYDETHTIKFGEKTTKLNRVDYRKKPSQFSGVFYATTNYESHNGNYRRPISTTNKPKVDHTTFNAFNSIVSSGGGGDENTQEKLRFGDYDDLSKQAILSIVDALLDGAIPGKHPTKGDAREETTTDSSTTTEYPSEPTTGVDFDGSTTEIYGETESTATTIINSTDCTESIIEDNTDPQKRQDYSFITTILPDDINEINKLEEIGNTDALSTTTEFEDTSTEATTTENIQKLPSDTKFKITQYDDAIPKIPPEIEALLNMTKNKDTGDYEYDYNEPSLPPSLPNLRIIPFVAADALDSKKGDTQDNTIYPILQERVTDPALFSYTSLFSPPAETEGGFVPKDPPLLDNFYENSYHTTGVDVNAVTNLPVASITNLPNTNEHNCISNGLEVRHGESVVSSSPCVICACFYGNVICQPPQCAPIRPNCRQTNMADRSSCCPHYICDDDEAPTVVLDRIEDTSNPQELVTVADGIVTPDPFRDVIRTEPAPDLQSLIGDIMPFLARKTTTIAPTKPISIMTTKSTNQIVTGGEKNNTTSDGGEEFSFQNALLELLFPEDTKSTKTTTGIGTTEEKIHNKTYAAVPTMTTTKVTQKTTTTPVETSVSPKTDNNSEDKSNESSTGSFLEKYTTEWELPNKTNVHPNSVEASPGVGLLKLAGCNIYGRMYRVGRIISELSGPCLECKCTEIGVQCRALTC